MNPISPSPRIRRKVLRSLSLVPLSGLALPPSITHAAQTCVLSPEMTEGPFFVDERLERADLVADAADEPGMRGALPLLLTLAFVDARRACAPMTGLQVDVWHTDALGNYSDVQGQRGRTFCRGYQVTDAAGRVSFRTVYPGWYPGRTIHIHVKARRFDANRRVTRDYTTQVYFDEQTNDTVMALPPYNRRGRRTTSNARDGIYANASSLIVSTAPRADNAPGLAGTITVGLDSA
jgi:protocatechuate 3,4-dioxygenase beta subunit